MPGLNGPAGRIGDSCVGCSGYADNIARLEHLRARDTILALVTPIPYARLAACRARMGWQVPWYAAPRPAFDGSCNLGEGFGLSLFMRRQSDLPQLFRPRPRRRPPALGFDPLALTPFGRQESWEDSSAGWLQAEPCRWCRRHDEYGKA